MTGKISNAPQHFGYFRQENEQNSAETFVPELNQVLGLKDVEAGLALQIYSPQPFGHLRHSTADAIHVSLLSIYDDEVWFDLCNDQYIEDGVAHTLKSNLLWDGIGTGIRYERQYAIFTAVPDRPGAFQRIIHQGGERSRESLTFAEAGDEVTLTFHDVIRPDENIDVLFRCQSFSGLTPGH